MNMATLLSVVLLGACVLSPAPARADPNQHNAPAVATVPASPNCPKATGSRLPHETTQCAAFGRSYTGEDLKQTGKTSLGDALRMLDPAITVR
jgi:hypothetical protein